MKTSFPKTIVLDFVTLELHEDYVVSTITEGTSFDMTHLEKLSDLFQEYYTERPFVSIANRRYDYAINPTTLMHSTIIPNLLGIGVVCYTASTYETAMFEKNFFKGNFELFSEIEPCLEWAKMLMEQSKKEKAGL